MLFEMLEAASGTDAALRNIFLDPALLGEAVERELCGRPVVIADGSFTLSDR